MRPLFVEITLKGGGKMVQGSKSQKSNYFLVKFSNKRTLSLDIIGKEDYLFTAQEATWTCRKLENSKD